MTRSEHMLRLVNKSMRGLEIAPGSAPVAPRADGWNVKTLDHVTVLAAQQRSAMAAGGADAAIPTDYVVDGRGMIAAAGEGARFDFIIASHITEFVPDFGGFLQDCQTMLKDGGFLILAIADKRLCYDDSQPLSSTETVLGALSKEKRDALGSLAQYRTPSILGVDRDWLGQPGNVKPDQNGGNGAAGFAEEGTFYQAGSQQIGPVFSPSSFELIVQDLRQFGLISFGVEEIVDAGGYEFFAILKSKSTRPAVNRTSLLRKIVSSVQSFAVATIGSQSEIKPDAFVLKHSGFCPICEKGVVFSSTNEWLRDYFVCNSCGSAPRERAVMHVLNSLRPDWRTLSIHESSPSPRGTSLKLMNECPGYVTSQYDPKVPVGSVHPQLGYRCEDLSAQTFPDCSFDVVVTQDVFEHLPQPEGAVKEICRTLRPNGFHVCSVPLVHKWRPSQVRAVLNADGTLTHLLPPEYHGNPIDDQGSLVTTDWGYDFASFVTRHSGMPTIIIQMDNIELGIRAEFIEIVVSNKPDPNVASGR